MLSGFHDEVALHEKTALSYWLFFGKSGREKCGKANKYVAMPH
jgi:hypothetical protein